MSEFDLTMRAAMQDDSLFYDLLERARKKGQSLQEFFISLGRKECQDSGPKSVIESQHLEQEPLLHDKDSLQRLADDFFAKMMNDPDAALEQMARETRWVDELDSWEVRELCQF